MATQSERPDPNRSAGATAKTWIEPSFEEEKFAEATKVTKSHLAFEPSTFLGPVS